MCSAVNGFVYAYALRFDGSGNFTRIASFYSGEAAMMSLVFDPESGYLWAVCDNKVTQGQARQCRQSSRQIKLCLLLLSHTTF